MLKNLSRVQVITLWFGVVALAVAACLLAGVAATPGTWALLLLSSLVPPALSFIVWQAPAQTVAEVLYAAGQANSKP